MPKIESKGLRVPVHGPRDSIFNDFDFLMITRILVHAYAARAETERISDRERERELERQRERR